MNTKANIALALLTFCGIGSLASAANQGSATIPVNIHVEPFYEVNFQPFTSSLNFTATGAQGGVAYVTGKVYPSAGTINGKLTCNKPVNLTWTITKPSTEPGSTWTVVSQSPVLPLPAGTYNNLGTITMNITGLSSAGPKTFGFQSAGYSSPVPENTAVLTLQVSIVNP